jgi:DNA-binding MarR family transcriptional regulator
MLTSAQHFIALLDELARMRGRTIGAFRDIREGLGLSEMETVVLSAVAGAAHPPTVPQIGRSLGHPRQVIQRAADTLAERGLVAWRDNADHKRARLLVATESGRALQAQGDAQGLALAAALTAGLDAKLIAQAAAALHAIRATIEKNLRQGSENEEA